MKFISALLKCYSKYIFSFDRSWLIIFIYLDDTVISFLFSL